MTDTQLSGNKKRKVETQLDSEAALSQSDDGNPPAAAQDAQDEDSMTEEQRLEAKRAYNRANSARSRHRQKQKIVDLSAKVEEQSKQIQMLEQTNGELVNQVRTLESEKDELNMVLQVFLQGAPGAGRGQTAPSSATVGPSMTRGCQLPSLQQASLFGCGNQAVGSTSTALPEVSPLMALLGKINENKLQQTAGTSTSSVQTLLPLGPHLFRRPGVSGQAASPTLTASVPPAATATASAPISPRTALARLQVLAAGSRPSPDPSQHTAADIAALMSLLGRTNEARAPAPAPEPSLAMQLLGLSQQQENEALLHNLLAQQQQMQSRNDDRRSDSSNMSAKKPSATEWK